MEKKKTVIKVLSECGTLTAKQISAFAKRKHNFDITPQGASGVMRYLVSHGMAGSSKDENNQTRYWLNSMDWETMKDDESF